MFKYVKFIEVKTEHTVLTFRGGDDTVKVNYFNVNAVSIVANNEDDIEVLVKNQALEIEVLYISQDEFKTLVANSLQLERIRDVVKEKIALKYDNSDEIAMDRKADDDVKKVAYKEYIQECLAYGYTLKAEIGY